MSRYHAPPPPEPGSLRDVPDTIIEEEAERQLVAFYPVQGDEEAAKVRSMLRAGIRRMVWCGTARIVGKAVLFLDPVDGYWRPYDEEYNKMMLTCLHGFRRVYAKGATMPSHIQPHLN